MVLFYTSELKMDVANFVEIVRFRALNQPDKTAFSFLQHQDNEVFKITYRELDQKAQAIACQLQNLTTPGDRAILLYPSGFDFIASFLACLYAGVIAVPAYPPRRNRKMFRLEAIATDAQATVALTTTSLLADINTEFAQNPALRRLQYIATDNLIPTENFIPYQATPDTLAFLQYTSGSTGIPKGVMVSHRNILHNSEQIQKCSEHTQNSHGVIWLPPYHDMGLIGGILQPLYAGFPATLMSPVDFIQKPLRWLEAISRYQGTTSGGPNFAYDLCVRTITPEQKKCLDLSCWDLAFNGAEPIFAETLEQFAAAFAECGFRKEAFYPCYGMAEATLLISGGLKTEPPIIIQTEEAALFHNQVVTAVNQEQSRTFVGVGINRLEEKILIVNPTSLTECSPNEVGEIWVSGSSIAQGYWHRPEETKQTFAAYLSDTNEGPFLHTGDLGFFQNGELFITGRWKDLIIIRGCNYYPQDIEFTVQQSHPSLRSNCVAAFLVDIEGEERLVVTQEVERAYCRNLDVEEVAAAIRSAVSEKHELQVYAVVLLKQGGVPKTSSGKTQRYLCKAGFLANSFDMIGSSILEKFDTFEEIEFIDVEGLLATPAEDRTPQLASYLQKLIASMLKLDHSKLDIRQPLTVLGIDSLLATQITYRIREQLKLDLPIQSFFDTATIADLTKHIEATLQEQQKYQDYPLSLPQIIPAPDQRYQPFPLTDIQQAYWVGRSNSFELSNVATHVYIEIESLNLNIARLTTAWQKIIERHDMLRTVVLSNGEQQILEKVPSYEIEVLDLQHLQPEAATAKSEEIRQQLSHQILSAEQWPLFEIRATRFDEQRFRLHISIDLLVADFGSLLRLCQEWSQLYQDPNIAFKPLEISFRDYVMAEKQLIHTELYQRSQEYWFQRLNSLPPSPQLPLAQNPSFLKRPQFKRRSSQLNPEIWQQLKQRASQAGLTPTGILLTAFAQILAVWSNTTEFTLNITLYNRQPLHPQVNEIIGNTISLMLLEVNNSTPDSFIVRAQNLQRQLCRDLDHSHISGIHVLRELARRQGIQQKALMPIVFTSILNNDSFIQDSSALNIFGEVVYSISQTSQVWLDHQVMEEKGKLVFNWDAVEDLFPDGLLDDMFAVYCDFLTLLATSNTVWTQTTYELVPKAELLQRASVNSTDAPISESMLHTLFVAQVQARRHNSAVISPRRTLTYLELFELANQVGHRLRKLNTTPNTLVAVVMEKGWEQIVAVLGILLAGAAYLPINPELPDERVQYLLQQGEVKLILTQSWLNQRLSRIVEIHRISLDNDDLLGEDSSPLDFVQSPDDLAYVIYTSGSTGQPKGVVLTHRGPVNTILDINQRFGVTHQDRVLALSTLNFDLSVYDIFATLAAGGTLVIPKVERVKDPSHWAELMEEHRVTVWNSVPAFMQMLVGYLSTSLEKVPMSLRLILMSGDRIPVNLPQQIKAIWEDVKIVSLGGPTETSIWNICYRIEKIDEQWKSIPYGKPITNQRYHVLNQFLEPCPVWVPGMLYAEGIGLAKGYWRDDNKTAESFIIHPRTRQRLYKTGDLGRFVPDGNIEILGREDFQVKINGYRIELGEIESALLQHESVKEAVVTATDKEHQSLVAYVVLNSEQNPSSPQHHQPPGAVLDSLERIDFKLKQPGLRPTEPHQTSIELPKPDFDERLTQLFMARQSHRQFTDQPLKLEQFSQFLSCLIQLNRDNLLLPKYRYPSAGSLYPVQTYLLIKPNRIEDIEGGVYYYHPREHSLILLKAYVEIPSNIHVANNQTQFEQSAFSLFLIGQLNAITPIYGELAKDFCFLEAGYIGQLLIDTASEHQVGLCPIGYLKFEELKHLFSLESSHILLHSFVGGMIDSTQTHDVLAPKTNGVSNSISQELLQYLHQKLPSYMIPSDCIILYSLPLNRNGKVDRKLLPKPYTNILKPEAAAVTPKTEIEQTLATIVQEVLQIEKIGIYDNFFDLGANSIHLVQINNSIKTLLGIELQIVEFFKNPNISYLANFFRQHKQENKSFDSITDRAEKRKIAQQKRGIKRGKL
ncbi:MAG: amino acid adenylation domain-containing protein [Dolichospermum sp. DEX182a]|nr:amino acid adenylation domain-containing protein [Dolichospermum sp. DEX182a]